MKSMWNSLIAGSCNVFGLALLVLSATAGGSAVRAADPSFLQNIVFDPISQIVLGIEERVAGLEATVAAFAGSFTSERIVAQEICVADGSGAQTCITKAQLDVLLKETMQAAQAPASTKSGAIALAASADEPVMAVTAAAVAMPAETPPPASERPAAIANDATPPIATADDTMSPAVAAVTPPTPEPIDRPATAADESATPSSEVAAAVPPATAPLTEQSAPDETDTPLPAAAAAMPQAVELPETVIATSTMPETATATQQSAEEQPATDEKPAHVVSTPVESAAPASNAGAIEEPPTPHRLE